MDLSFPEFTTNENVQNDNLTSANLTQSYLLLKKKICETHEVIKQYNDKLKECERLKTDLDAATKQIKKVTCNYNSTLAKVIKLELQNTEYKKNIDTLTNQIDNYVIKAAADQQHIQQLICKIKDVECQQDDKIMQYDLQKSSFEMRVKELEMELKTMKKSSETKVKKIVKRTSMRSNDCHNSNNIVTKDVATNTSNSSNIITKNVATNTSNNSNIMTKNVATNTYQNRKEVKSIGIITTLTKDEIVQKPQVADKCLLTDEFYNVKDDMYPVFCSKCEVHINPPPIDKICEIMMGSCPKLIEKISSPPKKRMPAPSDVNREHVRIENLADSPPPHFHTEIVHSEFISPNFPPPVPFDHLDYCRNFSRSPSSMSQSASCIKSTPISMPPVRTSAATQTNKSENESGVTFSLQNRIDKLEKKLQKKIKKLKSQKRRNCCQFSQPPPNSHYMFDMGSAMQFNFMELWRRMTDFYQNKEREPVVARRRKDKSLNKSKLSRLKAAKRLQSTYSRSSWKVDVLPKKVDTSSPRKKPKKRKHKSSMLLKKSEVSMQNSDYIEEPISDSDTDTADDTFDNTPTKADSTESKESCMDTIDSMCNDDLKTITHSTHSGDVDESMAVDRAKNSAECSKSAGGETDSGILSDSIESNKLQFEAELDSCFIRTKNARDKLVMKDVASFAGNFKSTRSQSTETQSTLSKVEEMNEIDEMELEISKLNEESQTPTPNLENVVRRKRKVDELEEPKKPCRQGLMRKIRNLRKNTTKLQGNTVRIPRLNYKETQHYENQCTLQEENHLEEEVENVTANDYVPKKRPRIAHIPKVMTEQNTWLNNCTETKTLTSKTKRDRKPKFETTIVGKTEFNTYTVEETNITQEAPEINPKPEMNPKPELNPKPEMNPESETNPESVMNPKVEINLEVDKPDELSGNENACDISTESVFDISNLFEQCKETREELDISSSDRKRTVTGIKNNLNCHQSCQNDRIAVVIPNGFSVSQEGTQQFIGNNQSFDSNSLVNNLHIAWKVNNNRDKSLNSKSSIEILKQLNAEKKSLDKRHKKQFKNLACIRLVTDEFVTRQLQRLVNSEWENTVHWDVIEKLKITRTTPRIIAKNVVEFLTMEEHCKEKLDNSYTPPAPLMTKTQQKIAALLVDLEKVFPTTIELVQVGIEYKMFKLNQKQLQRSVVDSLARIYTILARIQKDRERVRIFCCDAIYCLGLNATIVLYTVFTCWPEVFPCNETNKDVLPKCIAHLTMSLTASDYPKLNGLKNLVSVYYKYPTGTLSIDMLDTLLTAFQETCHNNIMIAIALLAKKESTAWTYKNIIKGALLPMIVNNKCSNQYKAFSLLGSLMRPFPTNDDDNSVGEIVEQLCALNDSNEGSHDQQEGVISALLSLSRHNFETILPNVLKWTPNALLHDRTVDQINGLYNQRDSAFWRRYISIYEKKRKQSES
ncbi:uncharacterized protein LOC117223973 isoform X1 [Megalopta genalis]|uniref:uncharacterized protein LOC117223973 isoform X1 n=1 Tax=Megalopta genalis TaxID=115081 RepID=UPI003FD4F84A